MEASNNIQTLLFSVKDTGIGIKDDKIDKLFTFFSQGDYYIAKKYGGSGLGLAICKAMVEKMGGKIMVTSQLGIGSEFSFTLPMSLQCVKVDASDYALKTSLNTAKMVATSSDRQCLLDSPAFDG